MKIDILSIVKRKPPQRYGNLRGGQILAPSGNFFSHGELHKVEGEVDGFTKGIRKLTFTNILMRL
jgi:hypothetical protein